MIVCVCRALRERDIANAVEQGCHSYKALIEKTGCCVECGQCATKIKAIYRVHQSATLYLASDELIAEHTPDGLSAFAATGT